MTDQEKQALITQASIVMIDRRKAWNQAERAARKARTAWELSETEHFNLVEEYKGTPP